MPAHHHLVAQELDEASSEAAGPLELGVTEHQCEGVACEATYDVTGAGQSAEKPRECCEGLITREVPCHLVDPLHVVDIYDQQREPLPRAEARRQLTYQRLLEKGAHVNPGQHVDSREFAQLRIVNRCRRLVAEQAQELERLITDHRLVDVNHPHRKGTDPERENGAERTYLNPRFLQSTMDGRDGLGRITSLACS